MENFTDIIITDPAGFLILFGVIAFNVFCLYKAWSTWKAGKKTSTLNKVKINNPLKDSHLYIHITVETTRFFRFRMWFGTILSHATGRVLGVAAKNIDVTIDDEPTVLKLKKQNDNLIKSHTETAHTHSLTVKGLCEARDRYREQCDRYCEQRNENAKEIARLGVKNQQLEHDLESVQNAYTMFKGEKNAWANAIQAGNEELVSRLAHKQRELDGVGELLKTRTRQLEKEQEVNKAISIELVELANGFKKQEAEIVKLKSDLEGAEAYRDMWIEAADRLGKQLRKAKAKIRTLNWLLTPQQKKPVGKITPGFKGTPKRKR